MINPTSVRPFAYLPGGWVGSWCCTHTHARRSHAWHALGPSFPRWVPGKNGLMSARSTRLGQGELVVSLALVAVALFIPSALAATASFFGGTLFLFVLGTLWPSYW